MPVAENGWNSEWNVPDSELTPQQRAAIQQHTENAKWAARLARGRQGGPGPRQTSRPSAQDTYRAEERQRIAKKKRIRERNQARALTVALAIILSILSLIVGMSLNDTNPTSQLAGILVTIGTIGCILAVPMIMLAVFLSE